MTIFDVPYTAKCINPATDGLIVFYNAAL